MNCQVTSTVTSIKVRKDNKELLVYNLYFIYFSFILVTIRHKHQLKSGDDLTINCVDLVMGYRAYDDVYLCTECKILSPIIDNLNPNLTNGKRLYRKLFSTLICKDWTKEKSSSSAN
ncbi:unnamed protein product [Rotaria sordida]|nr:unnamed protein product [Rotaria sordida]CAF0846601.1 unnamed protein product [Rotaria sordida]CAF0921465.1 unnamed protein product [Rotaria sordida]CAF3758226.1 unnamed protein product [Rotaria sordida]CAF3776026.1 unnamed protein product [Rotaria sordida]